MQFNSETEQLAALDRRGITSAELVEATIRQIEMVDKDINAVVVRDFDRARQAARDTDRSRQRGDARPLLGLPVTVKEAFDVEGLPTTWGLPGNHKPALADAVLVERLRLAGAVVLGKTNVAMMLSDWQTTNPLFGATCNPRDPGRTPGGSSGGGAAAVAAGMTSLDFGSDLAGSLRIPAAFCGVFAHRPSHGMVPMRGFAPPMAPRTPIAESIDQSTVGPIARSAAGIKLGLDVVAGADIPCSTGWKLALPQARHSELADFRVLVLDEHPLAATENAIKASVDELATRLNGERCSIGRSAQEVPDLKDLTRTFSALLMSLMGVDMPEDEYTAAAARARSKNGHANDQSMTMSHRDWVLLNRHRLALAGKWLETFRKWDVVICPVAPTTAFPHDQRAFEKRKLHVNGTQIAYDKLPYWTALGTAAGLPATTVPVGTDDKGMPIGVQIIGPRLEDYTTLAFADFLEKRLGYRFVPPPGLHS